MNDRIFQEISDRDFGEVNVHGKSTFLINKPKTYRLFFNFSDAMPLYTEEHGPHILFHNGRWIKDENGSCKNGEESGYWEDYIMPLHDLMLCTMQGLYQKGMTNKDFFQLYVQERGKFVKELIENTFKLGFEIPSSVQALTFHELVQLKDCIIQSKAGTGKTHAVCFGMLWHLDPYNTNLQYIFITNSHEMAKQTHAHVRKLMPPQIKIALCYGLGQKGQHSGQTMNSQELRTANAKMAEEASRAQIIVCTMGKFYDYLYNKKCVNITENLTGIWVDEFDVIIADDRVPKAGLLPNNMPPMSKQFERIITDINRMCQTVNERNKNNDKIVQHVYCSATTAMNAVAVAYNYRGAYNVNIGDPFIALLKIDDQTITGVNQYYILCTCVEEKFGALNDLLNKLIIIQCIIFVNSKKTIEDIMHNITSNDMVIGSSIDMIHGDMTDAEREEIVNNFSQGRKRLLIATNLLARGFDVRGVNLVINFDMPDEIETYVHRIGRSGRYGRNGNAITFLMDHPTYSETYQIKDINQRSQNSEFKELSQADMKKLCGK